MRSQGLAYLQVAVAALRAAPAFAQVTPGRAVEEVAVVVAAAVLFQDVPHLRFEERHVHIDRHHLQDTPEDTHPQDNPHFIFLKVQNFNMRNNLDVLTTISAH